MLAKWYLAILFIHSACGLSIISASMLLDNPLVIAALSYLLGSIVTGALCVYIVRMSVRSQGGLFTGATLVITHGKNTGQKRTITGYDPESSTITVREKF